jgi:hypothetical protein
MDEKGPPAPISPIEGSAEIAEEKPDAPAAEVGVSREVPPRDRVKNGRKIRVDSMMLVVTLLAACFTYYQARVAERARLDAKEIAVQQLKQAAEQFRSQSADAKAQSQASSKDTSQALELATKNANAAKRSADAAEAAAVLQREVFKTQERPWIGVTEVTFEATREDSVGRDRLTVTANTRVWGNSPATNVTIRIKAWLGYEGAADDTEWGENLAQEPALLPGATQVLTYHLSRSIPSEARLTDDIGLEGAIQYFDTFDAVHETRTCFIGEFALGHHTLVPCTAYNSMTEVTSPPILVWPRKLAGYCQLLANWLDKFGRPDTQASSPAASQCVG